MHQWHYDNPLHYYAMHGPITAPGAQAALLERLPTDLPGLCRAFWGLLLHPVTARLLGLTLAPARLGEQDLRFVAPMLARLHALDPRPLGTARPPERRLVGNCRDFATLLCATLRHQGRPARARAGFATYLHPDLGIDHWLCEYWHTGAARWAMVDPGFNLDTAQYDHSPRDFDPLDVPPSRFLVAGRAWQQCRAGTANPDHFGIPGDTGLGYIGSQVARDLAALNKRELLCWDTWGLGHTAFAGIAPNEAALLDRTAERTLAAADNATFPQLRALYETEPLLRVPAIIHSLDMAAGGRPLDVVALPDAVLAQ